MVSIVTTGEQWGQIKQIVADALERPPVDRSAFLDQVCPSAEIRDEVESLLVYEATRFLEAPISPTGMSGGRLEPGTRLGNFEIVELIGSGGMGDVYLSTDTRLGRRVAIKVLPAEFAADPDRRSRFEQEARAAAALNHPHIAVVYDVGSEATGVGGLPDARVHYIVQEYLEGEPLGSLLRHGALSPRRVVDLAIEITEALAAAHAAGIVHRDLKPDNIFVTREGHAKLLDFGVAKLGPEFAERRSVTEMRTQHLTAAGGVVGTTAYMAPEQLRGRPVDSQADLWALGVLIYQMTTGKHPFLRDTPADTASAILGARQEPLDDLIKDAPAHLEAIIDGLLHKSPHNRPSVGDVLAQLELSRSSASGQAFVASMGLRWRPPRALVAAVVAVLTVGGFWAYRAWDRAAKASLARLELLPEIERLADLVEAGEGVSAVAWEAFHLAQQAEELLPADPALVDLWSRISFDATIQSTPPGARVYARPYSVLDAPWRLLGTTPIKRVRVPRGYSRWRAEKEGYVAVERLGWGRTYAFDLAEEGVLPAEMVLVAAGTSNLRELSGLGNMQESLSAFLIDRFEVTNRDYKRFVDADGYTDRDYWLQPFLKDGRTLDWEEAMALLVDRTGRPGPATWQVGNFALGEGDYPVGGISWYEAAAYAVFVGKELPTIFHWNRAADTNTVVEIVPLSNIAGQAPAGVGDRQAMNFWGTEDMAGNVREWTLNASSGGAGRFILGGGWDDPAYYFHDALAQPPFDRSWTNGIRLMRYFKQEDDIDRLSRPVERFQRDFPNEPSVPDETFDLYLRQFRYDRSDLDVAVEESIEEQHWVRQRISFNAAYGGERMAAYLYAPKHVEPPFQTVVYFPGAGAIRTRAKEPVGLGSFDFLIRGGRAVMYPIYKGTHERGDDLASGFPDDTVFFKDHVVMWVKDYSRSIDYLETRTDIDLSKLALYGESWGGQMSAIVPAVEKRLTAVVATVAGMYHQPVLPEVDALHYLPRITVPFLMINGRDDYIFPLETSQKPMYELLGTAAEHKRLRLYSGTHYTPRVPRIKDTLAWLDRYLGPVGR